MSTGYIKGLQTVDKCGYFLHDNLQLTTWTLYIVITLDVHNFNLVYVYGFASSQ